MSGSTLVLTDPVNGTTADASTIATNNANIKTIVNGGVGTVNLASSHAEFCSTISTTSVTVAVTTEASATTVLAFPNTLFDGAPVIVDFFAPSSSITTTNQVTICLFEGSTELGRLANRINVTATTVTTELSGRYRFTPTAATHTYSICAFKDGGTVSITGGAGGTGAYVPILGRITKA